MKMRSIVPPVSSKKVGIPSIMLWATIFIFLGGLLCLNAGCSKKIKRGPANILLITVDTLRADRLGVYGYPYIHTPVIDNLAAEGIMFEHALASVPLTLPSHASILTGLYPPAHGVRDNNRFVVPENITTIAEILRKRGYQTGAIVASFALDRVFGLKQGFDTYDDSGMDTQGESDLFPERKADIITDHALAWLRYQTGKEPFFLWAHYYDPHAIYKPPSPFAEEYVASPYDGEIAFTDREIGRLLEGIQKMHRNLPLAVFFTSDHGESLGEHGEPTHALFIYHSTSHVPLIISAPELLPSNVKIKTQVSNVAMAPTILDLLGIPIPGWMQERSLFELIENKGESEDLPAYVESQMPLLNYGWSDLRGISAHGYFYIEAPKPELYDLKNDFAQLHNLFKTNREIAERMKKLLKSTEKKISNKAFQKAARAKTISGDAKRKLAALGYLDMGQEEIPFEEISAKNLPDPKDNRAYHRNLIRASVFLNDNSFTEAILILEGLLKNDPKNPRLLHYCGKALKGAGRIEEARIYVEKARQIRPNFISSLVLLGTIELETGNIEKAKALYEAASEVGPSDVVILKNLAKIALLEEDKGKAKEYLWEAVNVSVNDVETIRMLQMFLSEKDEIEKLRKLLEAALKDSPTDCDLMDRLAQIHDRFYNDREGALQLYQQFVDLEPRNALAHYRLAQALIRGMDNVPKGPGADYEGALQHFRKALELDSNSEWADVARKNAKELESILGAGGRLRR